MSLLGLQYVGSQLVYHITLDWIMSYWITDMVENVKSKPLLNHLEYRHGPGPFWKVTVWIYPQKSEAL